MKVDYTTQSPSASYPVYPEARRPRRYSRRSRQWTSALMLLIGLCCLLAALSAGYVSTRAMEADGSAASQATGASFVPGSFLVGLETAVDHELLAAYLAANGLELVRYWPDLRIAHLRTATQVIAASGNSLEEASIQQLNVLHDSDLFRFAEPDGLVFTAAQATDFPPDLEPAVNDPLAPEQYALIAIRTREAWNITYGDPKITVAVIDTGYSPQHEDFAFANLWRNEPEFNGLPNIDDDANGYIDDMHGWDWFEGNNNPIDANGHGTHIIGSIIAQTNNNAGVAGLARNVRVAPLRIFGPTGSGSISDLVAAIDYAVDMGNPIINLSLTTGSDSFALRESVARAAQRGVLVIAATGNMPVGSNFTSVQFPAAYVGTVAVAATNDQDSWATFSRYGPSVDIAAPGESILSTHLNSEYRRISGTSMATAHVSALAALILSLRPDLNPTQVMDIIFATADDVNAAQYPGKDNFLGHGRIDMAAALLEASRGLMISADNFTIVPPSASTSNADTLADMAELRVRVTAPGAGAGAPRRAVHNAVVHARAYPVGEDPPGPEAWVRMLTDVYGEALLPVPLTALAMQIDLQIGAVAHTVEAHILPVDAGLTLAAAVSTAVVGSGPVPFELRLEDAQKNVLVESALVRLHAQGGTLPSGVNSTNVNLVDGKYTGFFRPGTVSGPARVQATLGRYSAAYTLELLPDAPHRIQGPSAVVSQASIVDNAVELVFTVTDRFGNRVMDGTPVSYSASAGQLSAGQTPTVDGIATVTLQLPRPQLQDIMVQAFIGGTHVQFQVEVRAVRLRGWLPSIGRTRIISLPLSSD